MDKRTVDKERKREMRNSSWFSSSFRRTRGLDENASDSSLRAREAAFCKNIICVGVKHP